MINLFKQTKGFNTSTFRGLIKNGVEIIPDEIKDKLIQVDDETYSKLQNHELMWESQEISVVEENGEVVKKINCYLVANPNYANEKVENEKQATINNIQSQISHYKSLLAQTDYRAIKYFEGYYTAEEYAPYKYQRQSYRDEINRLEKELEKYNI